MPSSFRLAVADVWKGVVYVCIVEFRKHAGVNVFRLAGITCIRKLPTVEPIGGVR